MSDGKRIVGNIDLTLNLSDKRGVKISWYVVEGEDDRASLNKTLDVMQDVVDRQAVRADIVAKRAERSMWEISLQNLITQNETLLTKRNGVRKMTSQEDMAIKNFDVNLQKCKNELEKLNAAIKAGEAKLQEA